MVGAESEIRLTLERPDRVMHDADHADRENHYRRIGRRTSMKVVVAYDAAGQGLIITAHPTQRTRQREKQRWP